MIEHVHNHLVGNLASVGNLPSGLELHSEKCLETQAHMHLHFHKALQHTRRFTAAASREHKQEAHDSTCISESARIVTYSIVVVCSCVCVNDRDDDADDDDYLLAGSSASVGNHLFDLWERKTSYSDVRFSSVKNTLTHTIYFN